MKITEITPIQLPTSRRAQARERAAALQKAVALLPDPTEIGEAYERDAVEFSYTRPSVGRFNFLLVKMRIHPLKGPEKWLWKLARPQTITTTDNGDGTFSHTWRKGQLDGFPHCLTSTEEKRG